MTRREIWITTPLLAFAILFGVYPKAVLDYITPSVQKTVTEMKAVTENIDRGGQKMKVHSRPTAEPRQP